MEIYAYSTQKDLVKVTMSAQEVVTLGIDPWRLDLFDENPVEADGAKFGLPDSKIYFSRLRPVTFVYGIHAAGYLCHFDGTAGVVYQGVLDDDRAAELTFTDLRAADLDFGQALRAYLENGDSTTPASVARAFAIYPPRQQWHLKLRNRQVIYIHNFLHLNEVMTSKPIYTGRMLDPITAQVELPADVNRAFEYFARWNPVVYGGVLRDTLLGQERREANVFIHPEHGSLEDHLPSSFALSRTDRVRAHPAVLDNCAAAWCTVGTDRYHVVGVLKKGSDKYFEYANFTVNQVIATAPNQITATRIALHDLHARTIRVASTYYYGHLVFDNSPVKQASELMTRGLTLASHQLKELEEAATIHQAGGVYATARL